MDHTQSCHFWHWHQVNFGLCYRGQRTFGTDDHLSQVERAVIIATISSVRCDLLRSRIGHKLIQIVTGHSTQNARIAFPYKILVQLNNLANPAIDFCLLRISVLFDLQFGYRKRFCYNFFAIRQDQIQRNYMVDGLTVNYRVGTSGIVPDGTTNVGTTACCYIGCIHQTVRV